MQVCLHFRLNCEALKDKCSMSASYVRVSMFCMFSPPFGIKPDIKLLYQDLTVEKLLTDELQIGKHITPLIHPNEHSSSLPLARGG